MHNSQDGSVVVTSGTGTTLLIDDCVGCHSNSTSTDTLVNGTPIVYNTTPPTNPLAGGNFYWVAQGGGAATDVFGHNVWGISDVDNNISASEGAPGGTNGNGCKKCHQSLALDPALSTDPEVFGKNGCRGCHTEVAHHDDSKPWFRFLKGHRTVNHYVEGEGDANWEQNPDISNHNVYKGIDSISSPETFNSSHSMTGFCSGCHTDFHEDMGVSSPWIRHPNDILLPTAPSSEYAAYDPTTGYSNEAPVAYLNPAAPVRAEAVVSCLSCHRAHGSDQPDMLRWDYTNMGTGGCFTCHTLKD
jgi:predicted CXXCH cytochrome family protein